MKIWTQPRPIYWLFFALLSLVFAWRSDGSESVEWAVLFAAFFVASRVDGAAWAQARKKPYSRERWTIVDDRTDKPVSMAVYYTRDQAEEVIDAWRERDAVGKRPDVSERIPHLVSRPVRDEERR